MHRILLPLLLLSLLFFPSCSRSNAPAETVMEPEVVEEPHTRIVVTSDFHFITPSLVEDFGFLEDVMMQSDGKCTQVTHLIVDAFINEMLEEKPEAILITGDLTLNGEKESHVALAEKLRPLLDRGIKVLVIPGNHDVNHTSYRFTATGVEEVPCAKPQEYEDIWLDYGYGDAPYQDPMSDSYLTPITDDLWVLGIDSNTGSTGTVRSATLKWMEEALKEVEEKGAKVISMTHQNLFVHNERFTFGYQLNNAKALLPILEGYGVRLNLSGHLHVQNILSDGILTEIDSSSLSVTPLQYGVLDIKEDGSYIYRTRELKDEELKEKAKVTFDSATYAKSAPQLGLLPEEDSQLLLENTIRLNREYFTGAITETSEEARATFSRYPHYSFGAYMLSLVDDTFDHRAVSGQL